MLRLHSTRFVQQVRTRNMLKTKAFRLETSFKSERLNNHTRVRLDRLKQFYHNFIRASLGDDSPRSVWRDAFHQLRALTLLENFSIFAIVKAEGKLYIFWLRVDTAYVFSIKCVFWWSFCVTCHVSTLPAI